MSTRMLIDARHQEETRVTVVKGSRIEEFDYESASKRPLKGNIYLARVTRVEPSLQAAFVEYGGNRHGFLAFSEIHPDYYQIPVEDRRELIEAETQAALERSKELDAVVEQQPEVSEDSDTDAADTAANIADDDDTDVIVAENITEVDAVLEVEDGKESDEADRDAEVAEAAARRQAIRVLKRKYNIQEVIKRRQVLLIQVVKEERGNKGAALTTYLSLAGRYCVLMPNSTHSGGISRKISNASDRRNLKRIISALEVPDEMGLIVRTAGMERTKSEIKRDYDYLLRLWNGIRDLTLQSVAPTLVYEEGSLIKRTIRDLYTRDIDEILVEGENGYKAAKEFMKLLMPSHAKKVQHYKDPIPLFHRYQVENHLEAMYQPVVQLRSGGYIVINPTEALISIDVNSGRATREHNIEETALKTNMEAAEEVARQLRLRDMAGLVVIDFIDMEERSNNRAVERRMKEVLKSDRARIQVGRISGFGLMEMSRQRLRSNLLEVSMETCVTCAGTGIVRSIESAALMALRQLEEEGIRGRSATVRVALCPDVAVYLLNKKRKILSDIETQYEFEIEILSRTSMGPSDIEITRETGAEPRTPSAVSIAFKADTETAEAVTAAPIEARSEPARRPAQVQTEDNDDGQPKRKRRRRRRRRRGGPDDVQSENADNNENASSNDENAPEGDESSDDGETAVVHDTDANTADLETSDGDRERPRRRRGSRGGRRRNNDRPADQEASASTPNVAADTEANPSDDTDVAITSETAAKPRRRRRVRRNDNDISAVSENLPTSNSATDAPVTTTITNVNAEAAKPRRGRRKKTEPAPDAVPVAVTAEAVVNEATEKKAPVRRRTRKTPVNKDAGSTQAVDETSDKPASEKAAPTAKKPRTRTKKADAPDATSKDATPKTETPASPSDKPAPGKRRTAVQKAIPKDTGVNSTSKTGTSKPASSEKQPSASSSASGAGPSTDTDGQPKRKGWWQRTFG